MLFFWLAIAGMTFIASAFLVYPLLRHPKTTFLIHEQQQFEALHQLRWGNREVITALIATALMIVLAAALYLHWGASQQWDKYQQQQKQAKEIDLTIKKLGSIENIIAKLQQQLAEKPDARGWFLLGRLYLKTNRFPKAVEAFAQAFKLQPNNPEILVSYAQALYFRDKSTLGPQSKALLTQALQLQPHYPDAINLLAIDAYQQRNYHLAISYWQQLLPQLPADSVAIKDLQAMIAQAEREQSKSGKELAEVKLPIRVDINPTFKKSLTGEELVFIYAQAVQGNAIPLAVVRRQVKELPLDITLTEKMAMVRGASLADATEVRIVARISTSGQPLPQPGDIEGRSGIIPISTAAKTKKINVIIDTEIAN